MTGDDKYYVNDPEPHPSREDRIEATADELFDIGREDSCTGDSPISVKLIIVRLAFCPCCIGKTKQNQVLFNPDDPNTHKVWQCEVCSELTEIVTI